LTRGQLLILNDILCSVVRINYEMTVTWYLDDIDTVRMSDELAL